MDAMYLRCKHRILDVAANNVFSCASVNDAKKLSRKLQTIKGNGLGRGSLRLTDKITQRATITMRSPL